MRKNIKLALIALVLSVAIAVVGSMNTAFAEGHQDDIFKKAALQGLFDCVNTKNIFWEIKGSSSLNLYNKSGFGAGQGDKKNKYFPTSVQGSYQGFPTFLSGDVATCGDLVKGSRATSSKTAFDVIGQTLPSSSNARIGQWLTDKAGYFLNKTENAKTSECYTLRFARSLLQDGKRTEKNDAFDTDSLCVEYDSSGKAISGSVPNDGEKWNAVLDIQFKYDTASQSFVAKKTNYQQANYGYGNVNVKTGEGNVLTIKVKGNTSSQIKSEFKKLATDSNFMWTKAKSCVETTSDGYELYRGACKYNSGINNYTGWSVIVTGGTNSIDPSTKKAGFITQSSSDSAALSAVSYSLTNSEWNNGYVGYRFIAGLTGYDVKNAKSSARTELGLYAAKKMYLTASERLWLYMRYFNEMMGAQVTCKEMDEGTKEAYKDLKIYWVDGKTIKSDCYALGDNRGKYTGYHGVTKALSSQSGDSVLYKFSGTVSFDSLLAFFKDKKNVDVPLDFDMDPGSYVDADPTDPASMNKANEKENEKKTDEKEKSCYDSAGSSNWIACPILEKSSAATTAIYDFITNMLQVNTQLFQTSGKTNGTFIAWETFRNIANVAFIIVFIIVILSQITGFGVDNYGIKKILPKLILGALLINISFYICQACVDVANITGGGIKTLLRNATSRMGVTKDIEFAFQGGKHIAAGTKIAAVIIIAPIIAASFYISGGAMLVPVLLAALAAIIGLVFFLVLLAVRQSLAVMLVVISPLAFMAYILPNTKTLFKRWLKLFSGVLLAYPICALMFYGGEMTSTILLVAAGSGTSTVTNIGLALTASIISIAPVFFVPTLITKTMGSIAAVSNRLQRGATTLAKGGAQRTNTIKGIEENAKGVKYRRAKNYIRGRQGKTNNAFQRARLRTEMGAVDAYERESAKMYETQAAGLSVGELKDMALSSFGPHGFDEEKFEAAFASASVKDPQKAWTEVFAALSGTDEYQKLKKEDPTGFAKLSNTLAKHGGVIGKAINKVNNDPATTALPTFAGGLAQGRIGEKIQNMSEDVIGQMDKDQFIAIGTMMAAATTAKASRGKQSDDYFTDEQVKHAMGMSMSGSDQKAFASNIINNMSQAQAQRVISGLTDEQWGLANNDNLRAMFNRAGSISRGATTVSDYKAFNILRATDVMASGNAELIGKLRSDQKEAYDGLSSPMSGSGTS